MIIRHAHTRGFTLLEVLLASTMVAVLAGSLYASLHVAFKARNSALSAVDTVRKCNLTIDLIRSDLQSAALPGTSATTAISVSFVGLGGAGATSTGNADLIFYASTTDILPSPGIGDVKKVEYTCIPSPDSGQFILVRQVTTNLLAPIATDPTQEVICRNVRAFTVTYYDGTAWQESWDSTTTSPASLPKAVEILIELNDDAGQPLRPVSRIIAIPVGQGTPTGSAS